MKSLILLSLLVLLIDAKKRKKEKDNFDPLEVRPRTFDHQIYCNACQAIVRETLKKIHHSKSELDVTHF